jgi:protein-S-isoprenylcysteine O-methyltransferase Ste14
MTTGTKIANSRAAHYVFSILLAATFVMFASNHIRAFQVWGEWSYLVFFLAETVMAVMFIVRTRAESVSENPFDWMIAFSGTFAPLFFSPFPNGLAPGASWVLIAGSLMMFVGVLSLNRSFGIVPARRIIKTSGAYALVRHPLYASYLVMFASYLIANTSWRNALVCIVAVSLMLARIFREERHLACDSSYRAYMDRVRYRLIPIVF